MAHISTTPTKAGTFEITSNGARASQVYNVQYDAPTTRRAACYAPGVPIHSSQHPDQAYIYVETVKAEFADQAGQKFDVSVNWGSGQAIGPGGEQGDPLTATSKLSMRPVQVVEDIDIDLAGNPIENSSLETFDPPIQRNFADIGLRIQRNEAGNPMAMAQDHLWTVNADPFFGSAPGTAIMASIEAEEDTDGPTALWVVTYDIIFRQDTLIHPKPWKIRVLDRGFRYKNTSGKWIVASDADGKPLNEPILLDGNGGPVDMVLLGLSNPTAKEPVWLEFTVYESKPWGPLALV